MKRAMSLVMVLVVIAAIISGCGNGDRTAPAPPEQGNPPIITSRNAFTLDENANLDADITIVQAGDMTSWDPSDSSSLANSYVIHNVYSRLFASDEYLKGIPELCREYEMVSDTEWCFTIYEGVEFHDGTIMTADDVVYSLERAKAGSSLFEPVSEISKIDKYTIRITTDGPYPSLVSALTHQTASILPMAYTEQCIASGDWQRPIGSGHYQFESRVPGESIKLVRFDDYFNQSDAALNASLTFLIMPDNAARTEAVKSGAADLNIDFETFDYDSVVKDAELQLWQFDSQNVWHIGINTQDENFSNPLVRQALGFAIDREACMQIGHNGKGTVVYNSSTFPPTILGAVVNPLDMYSYNPEKAKALMEQAGCEGFETRMLVFRDETERIANLCASYLAEIGITAEVIRIPMSEITSYSSDYGIPLHIISWGAYWDPDLFLSRRFGGSYALTGYQNDEVDIMIREARSTFDEEERAAKYREIQEFMALEAPEVSLYVSVLYALAAVDLKGVEINVERAYNYHKLHY